MDPYMETIVYWKEIYKKIEQQMHDVPMVGHHRERTMRATLSKNLYWHKMKEVVEHYVCTCVKCQSTKSMNKKKYEFYGALTILTN
jgi:translation initiation factor 2 beta subunit (eIF-2beta)/eIF-5